MKKLTLLIDQDDVLADYMGAVTENFNKKYHTNIKVEDCISWDLYPVFGKEIETVMHEPELFRNLKPMPYALEVFERLYRSGLFEIYIVTAAHPRSVEAKYQWLEQYLPFFPKSKVIVCSHKFMIKGDYLLDDGMHNIVDFARAGGTPIVFTRAHNVYSEHSFKSVANWLEFERFIVGQCTPEQIDTYYGNETAV